MAALRAIPEVRLHEAVNRFKGFLRYPETLLKLLYVRIRHDPSVYFLGFRGHELFWPVRIVTWRRKLIFDELMSPTDSLINEQKRLRSQSPFAQFLLAIERGMLRAADLCLTDTPENRDYYTNFFGLDTGHIQYVPVGADDSLFVPTYGREERRSGPFRVLFYGSFLPLHGIDVILDAAFLLKGENLYVDLVGGKGREYENCARRISQQNLINVRQKKWVHHDQLPSWVEKADLCLAGSFGSTGQAFRVITGKTFQALAMGTACLVPEHYERWGFVDRENCIMPNGNDAKALAEAMIWCQNNREKLDLIGREGRTFYEQAFSTTIQIKHLKIVLNS